VWGDLARRGEPLAQPRRIERPRSTKEARHSLIRSI
jgi:hypothetical protein